MIDIVTFADIVRHDLVGEENGTPSTFGIQMLVASGHAWAAEQEANWAGSALPDISQGDQLAQDHIARDPCTDHRRVRCKKCRAAPEANVKCRVPMPDGTQARDRIELGMVAKMRVARCLYQLTATVRSVDGFPEVDRLLQTLPGYGAGEIVVRILRTYERWRLFDDVKALGEVHALIDRLHGVTSEPVENSLRAVVSEADRILVLWCERFERSEGAARKKRALTLPS